LTVASLSRSTYYYHRHQQADCYVSEKQLIQDVYHQHKGRYGYQRIGLALKRLGVWLNHCTKVDAAITVEVNCAGEEIQILQGPDRHGCKKSVGAPVPSISAE